MTLYLQVDEPIWSITGSTRVNRVLGEPGKKSTRIEICKKKFNPIHPEPVVSRVGSRVSTHFDNSSICHQIFINKDHLLENDLIHLSNDKKKKSN